MPDLHAVIVELRARLRASEQERENLQSWRESAFVSLRKWHDLGATLQTICPLTVGDDIPATLEREVPEAFRKLKEECETQWALYQRLIEQFHETASALAQREQELAAAKQLAQDESNFRNELFTRPLLSRLFPRNLYEHGGLKVREAMEYVMARSVDADALESKLAALQTCLASLEQEMRTEADDTEDWDWSSIRRLILRWADALHAARTRHE